MKLSLDSASKSAEIVAAIAVVLSLIYVGYQMQQNTKAIRSTVHQSLVGHVTATEGLVVTNADLAQIMLKSDSNPDSLTPEERLRFDAFITLEFVNWENAYLNYQEGFVEERVWQAWDKSYYPDAESRARYDFWLARRQWYDESFARHVDKIYGDRGYKPPTQLTP